MLARSLRFRGFSGFLMVLMVWNVIPVRQSIRGLRQRSPTELTSAWVHDGVCVRVCAFSDENGQRIVQTDNELWVNYYRPFTGGDKPNHPLLNFLYWLHPNSSDAWTAQQKPLLLFHSAISACFPAPVSAPTRKHTHARIQLFTQSQTQLFAGAWMSLLGWPIKC